MSTRTFNLIPPEIALRVARGRATRTVFACSGLLAALAAGMFACAHWMDSKSAEALARAQSSGAPVVAIEAEIAALHAEHSAIDELIETQRALGVSIPASAVVGAIQSSLPNGALLERIDLEFANVQGSQRVMKRNAKPVETPRVLNGEISGIASDEGDVGAMVDALAALAPMQRVSLESSRSREFRGRSAREFRVTFTVDLDRRWKLPALSAAASETGVAP